MKKLTHVLDACAVLAHLYDEEGAEQVSRLYLEHCDGEARLGIHAWNVCEVYYHMLKVGGGEMAESMLRDLAGLEIHIERTTDDVFIRRAARFKASHNVALADAAALALATISGARLVTCDHHDFDAVDAAGTVSFHWIR